MPELGTLSATPDTLPRSIAIAGAWGYIGRRFLDVALAHGLKTYVFDPGPPPKDVDLSRLTRVTDEAEFYRVDADLFHLATHPEYRRTDLLLARDNPPLILNEKPMAQPQRPEQCRQVIDAVDRSRAVMLYDFPELFDPLTAWLLDHLAGLRDVKLTSLYVQRSKDREDPSNRRNEKRMVDIQYQESVHDLAFALYVTVAVQGGVEAVLNGGVRLSAKADRYAPPNPEAYPAPVDGRCEFTGSLGRVRVDGLTDFKRGAPWAKQRIVRGTAGGRPFEIELSYLEGHKSLRVDGVDQPVDPAANSYESVLVTATRWHREVSRTRLMEGLYPNPRFTRATYQLSSVLWRSSRDRAEIGFDTADGLYSFDAKFAAAGRA